ncbi:DEAD/DEAH box helicase [Nocardia crassostreae]|uniref:DEAD/DEAH box helicase n=1 Tax=Nocardia crassostreae TaxID=53428 RepID=UPI001FE0C063|nr:DEAD/DEAH box helicase [Nocardia crassostreae]
MCSTGDLVSAARCEFALLRALDAELGLVTPVAPHATGAVTPARDQTVEHKLADLRDRYGTGVVRVRAVEPTPGLDPTETAAALATAHERTRAAMDARADAIAGAVLMDGQFAARCDFLLLDSTPEAHDYLPAAVATRRTAVTALLTVAAALAALAAPTPGDLFVSTRIPGPDPGPRTTPTPGDLIISIRAHSSVFDSAATAPRLVNPGDHSPSATGRTAAPSTAPDEADLHEQTATGERGTDDVVPHDAAPADGPGHDIPELESAVVATALGSVVPVGDAPDVGDSRLGIGAAEDCSDGGFGSDPGWDELRRSGVPLDPADPADAPVVFRIRVDEPGAQSDSGGAVEADDGWALLELLAQRQRAFPGMRIHHYRGGLRPLLSALGERHADGEDMVAEVLPALVDLYPVVRAALLVGERSYDLHQLPPNQAEAGSGPEAVVRLRDWLLRLAAEHRVRPVRRMAYDYWETGPDEVEAAPRAFAETGQRGHWCEAQVAAAFMAAALGYHRREGRPLRWAHDDRLDHPVEEWADTPGVLIADWGAVDTKWHSTGHRPMRRYLTLTGRLGTGNAPPPGTRVLTLYDRPVQGMTAAPGQRALAHATVLGCSLDTNFEDVVRIVELLPDGCEPYDDLPAAIAPCPQGRQEFLAEALDDTAHQLLVTLPQVPDTAVFDLLCRRPPRLRSGETLPEVFGDHAAAVTAAILDLENSYIAVQGPPGTGKTDTTARVVERLVTRYKWRVGVVARSHAVVEHMLDAVVQVGVLPELVAKADAQSVAPEWLPIEAPRYSRFLDNAVNGCVVGGLSNDFADAERIARAGLDLLVIADAGKFPLAEAVAVAVCARNLLLVGDPAPAAGQGAHPEPVGESALGRLVGAHRTLPAAFGYFLDRTWRMHPRMSGPVSRLRYDNRLRSNETVTLARELDGMPPGVRTVTVEHHGNSTESAEEAREIVRQVRTLLGLPWQTGAVTRRLHPHDILVVAPYHAQVARIRTLLSRARIEDVLVGTADHFQGREAAVVLVSMTTSAPEDAPHGIGALLSRHWLTSAISRAMWAAVIVRSPLLTEYLPATTAEVSDLAAVLQLDRV